jgi:hypothetical protein
MRQKETGVIEKHRRENRVNPTTRKEFRAQTESANLRILVLLSGAYHNSVKISVHSELMYNQKGI